MSGNCGNPDNEAASKVWEKLCAIGNYVKKKLRDGEQSLKIFSNEYEGFFDKMIIIVEQLQKDGKYIDWLNVLEQLSCYEKSIYLIVQLVLTAKQVRNVMKIDLKSHKDRINHITRSLQDIETKTTEYSKEVEDLGKQWKEILENDVEHERRVKSFDFTFDQLFIKIKSCTSNLLSVKHQIRQGSEAIHEYRSQHDMAMGDVRKLGIGAVGVGLTTCSSSGGRKNSIASDDKAAGSGKGASWGEIIGGVVAAAGAIAVVGSFISSLITSHTTDEIQKEYEKLDFEADKLQQTVTQLTEAMENYKEHRSNYSN